MREAIEFHIEGMREEGLSIPIPQSRASCIEVAAYLYSIWCNRVDGPLSHLVISLWILLLL